MSNSGALRNRTGHRATDGDIGSASAVTGTAVPRKNDRGSTTHGKEGSRSLDVTQAASKATVQRRSPRIKLLSRSTEPEGEDGCENNRAHNRQEREEYTRKMNTRMKRYLYFEEDEEGFGVVPGSIYLTTPKRRRTIKQDSGIRGSGNEPASTEDIVEIEKDEAGRIAMLSQQTPTGHQRTSSQNERPGRQPIVNTGSDSVVNNMTGLRREGYLEGGAGTGRIDSVNPSYRVATKKTAERERSPSINRPPLIERPPSMKRITSILETEDSSDDVETTDQRIQGVMNYQSRMRKNQERNSYLLENAEGSNEVTIPGLNMSSKHQRKGDGNTEGIVEGIVPRQPSARRSSQQYMSSERIISDVEEQQFIRSSTRSFDRQRYEGGGAALADLERTDTAPQPSWQQDEGGVGAGLSIEGQDSAMTLSHSGRDVLSKDRGRESDRSSTNGRENQGFGKGPSLFERITFPDRGQTPSEETRSQYERNEPCGKCGKDKSHTLWSCPEVYCKCAWLPGHLMKDCQQMCSGQLCKEWEDELPHLAINCPAGCCICGHNDHKPFDCEYEQCPCGDDYYHWGNNCLNGACHRPGCEEPFGCKSHCRDCGGSHFTRICPRDSADTNYDPDHPDFVCSTEGCHRMLPWGTDCRWCEGQKQLWNRKRQGPDGLHAGG